MSSMAKWARGAALLGLAALTVKLLGAAQKIPLQNLAGDAAFGLYSAVYPVYSLLLVLATAGYPVAISKFISEYEQAGDMVSANRMMRVASLWMAAVGMAGCALFLLGAETIAGWIGAEQAASAIRAVGLSLLTLPWLAAIRGYEQGRGRMGAAAASQVAEQVLRVAFMVTAVIVLTRQGADDGKLTAYAMLGSTVGAAGGMLLLLPAWRRGRRELAAARAELAAAGSGVSGVAQLIPGSRGREREWFGLLLRRFLAYALPVSLVAGALPLLYLVDSFTLLHLLRRAGYESGAALAEFGIYQRGVPLVQLIVMTAASAGGALVPALAQARAAGRDMEAGALSGSAIRLAVWLGLASAAGLALIAVPANIMLYGDGAGSGVLALMAAAVWFAVVHAVTGSVLQGSGDATAPARSLVAAAALKLALNAALVPALGIAGAALALVAAYGLAAALQLAALARRRPAPSGAGARAAAWLASVAAMAAAAAAVEYGLGAVLHSGGWAARSAATLTALGAIAAGAAALAVAAMRFGAVREPELAALAGRRWPALARPLRRLRLLAPCASASAERPRR